MLLVGVGVVAIALVGCLIAYALTRPSAVTRQTDPTQTESDGPLTQAGYESVDLDTLVIDGVQYQRRKDLRTVLFCGVDNTPYEATDFTNMQLSRLGRADTIVLMILNDEARTLQLLEISRDTMVDVEVYNADDTLIYTDEMQITLQYLCGSSHRRCQWLMGQRVSELLYGVPVNNNMSLTMDGIAVLVDAVGGLTVTMPEDYTYIDPRYQQGATVTLSGAETNTFVRYRDTEVTGSNDVRMARQTWFVKQLFHMLGGLCRSRLAELLQTAEPYFFTDLDVETIFDLTQYDLVDDILKLPGATREGEEHDEYYVDESALQKLMLQVFYVPVM